MIAADPNNPAWKPPEGWDKVWDFLVEDDIYDFSTFIGEINFNTDYVYVEKDVKNVGYMKRIKMSHLPKVVAMAERHRITHDYPLGTIDFIVNGNYFGIDIKASIHFDYVFAANEKATLKYFGNEKTVSTTAGPWRVFYVGVDTENKKVTVALYDKDGGVIAKLVSDAKIRYAEPRMEITIKFSCEHEYAGGGVFEVDWIALRYDTTPYTLKEYYVKLTARDRVNILLPTYYFKSYGAVAHHILRSVLGRTFESSGCCCSHILTSTIIKGIHVMSRVNRVSMEFLMEYPNPAPRIAEVKPLVVPAGSSVYVSIVPVAGNFTYDVKVTIYVNGSYLYLGEYTLPGKVAIPSLAPRGEGELELEIVSAKNADTGEVVPIGFKTKVPIVVV